MGVGSLVFQYHWPHSNDLVTNLFTPCGLYRFLAPHSLLIDIGPFMGVASLAVNITGPIRTPRQHKLSGPVGFTDTLQLTGPFLKRAHS
jgi:hypothetical protein